MCFQKVRKIRITEKAAAEHYHYKVMISNQLVANYWHGSYNARQKAKPSKSISG